MLAERWRLLWRYSDRRDRERLLVLLAVPGLLCLLPDLSWARLAWICGLLAPFPMLPWLRLNPKRQRLCLLLVLSSGLLGLSTLSFPQGGQLLFGCLGFATALPVALVSDPVVEKQQVLQRELKDLQGQIERHLESIRQG